MEIKHSCKKPEKQKVRKGGGKKSPFYCVSVPKIGIALTTDKYA